jgi:plasmid stabilization system protein ParE
MSLRPEFTGTAAAEYLAAARWCESDRTGRGRRFELAVEATLNQIANRPESHPLITETGFRRAVIRRFPYALFYRLESGRTIVHAVFHTSRNPSTLRARLGDA